MFDFYGISLDGILSYSFGAMMLIIQCILVIFCAYTAGTLKATLDIDAIDGRDFDWKIAALAICNLIASGVNLISIIGRASAL